MLHGNDQGAAVAGRRTNLALLALLAIAIVTGLIAFAIGTGWGWVVVIGHGVTGLAMLVLVPWKSAIVQRGIGRQRSGRLASIVLAALVVVTIASGVLFSTGLVLRYGPLNAIQVHVGSALLGVPLAVFHIRARPVRLARVDLTRRNLLRASSVFAAGAFAWLGVEGATRALSLSGSDRRFTGSHERGSFNPPVMPTTQWFDDSTQRIDAQGWSLALNAGTTNTCVGTLTASDGGGTITFSDG